MKVSLARLALTKQHARYTMGGDGPHARAGVKLDRRLGFVSLPPAGNP